MPHMTEAELKAVLAAERADALAAGTLARERADALDYYLGEMRDVPPAPGRSGAVSTDVADTVEALMPPLMEIFCGSDEVVRFEPVGAEDVAAAEQETDYVNHVFMQKNPGFLVLYSFIKDALLCKIGIVKVFAEETEEEERKTFYGQSDDALAVILAEPGVELVAHSERPDPAGAGVLHDVTVVCRQRRTCARVEPVPPEEFGIARTARSIRDATYCFHEVRRTEAELIAAGFDAGQVRALPGHAAPVGAEAAARDTVAESTERGGDGSLNRAMRRIRVTEHYIRMDYDGSGRARLHRVVTGGEADEVLRRDGRPAVVEEDCIPFAAMTPVIMTHRFFGRSIADLVMDIQRIKTALLRAVLDNAYLANNPRVEMAEEFAGSDTLDDLLVSRPGGVVRTRRPGGIAWQTVPSIGGHVYPLVAYMDQQKELRTGVTRQGQGIDADALQNQSATAVNQLYSASQARIKLIARIFAETGIRDLFWLLHHTIRKHGQRAETVRLRNAWITVDPRQWKSRHDLTVNVGLGSGGRAERIAQVMALMRMQKDALQGGLRELVQPKNIYNAGREFLRLIELKNADAFLTDPDSEAGRRAAAAPAEPPALAEAKARIAIEQGRAEAGIRIDQAKMQAAAQREADKLQLDAALRREQMAAEFALRREQMEREFALRREQVLAELAARRAAGTGPASPKGGDGITDTQLGGEMG